LSVEKKKMSTTRRPLGSLSSVWNVGGEEALRRRVGPERTPVEPHTRRMYAKREEGWRPLTRQRVAAFIRLFVLCFVEVENGLRFHPVTYQMMQKTLVKRIIPWIYNRLIFAMDKSTWPITLEQFKELDAYLAEHLPRIHKDDQWDTVAYFFKEVLHEGEEWKRLKEMEKEVMESVRRCLEH